MKNDNQNIFLTDIKEFHFFSANFIKEKLEGFTKTRMINIALSGGNTPLPVLNILKDFDLDWDRFNFFLVDERGVSVDSDESNYKNINEVFYKHISSKSYSVLQENISLDDMVITYKKNIKDNVDFTKSNLPKFDLIILGMGNDGHTASLFPNTEALNEYDEFVVKNHVPQLDCYRVTLTFPVLLNSKESIVLVKGEEKIRVFEEVINGKGEKYPIAKLKDAKLNWIISK